MHTSTERFTRSKVHEKIGLNYCMHRYAKFTAPFFRKTNFIFSALILNLKRLNNFI